MTTRKIKTIKDAFPRGPGRFASFKVGDDEIKNARLRFNESSDSPSRPIRRGYLPERRPSVSILWLCIRIGRRISRWVRRSAMRTRPSRRRHAGRSRCPARWSRRSCDLWPAYRTCIRANRSTTGRCWSFHPDTPLDISECPRRGSRYAQRTLGHTRTATRLRGMRFRDGRPRAMSQIPSRGRVPPGPPALGRVAHGRGNPREWAINDF